MGFLDFIRSVLGAGHGSPASDKVNPAGGLFNLDDWVSRQKATYGSRPGLAAAMDSLASQFNRERVGISGSLLDHLVHQRPRMIPKDFWGGGLGWRSVRRRKRWEDLLTRNGIAPVAPGRGVLIRFYIDATEWVPHPYAPPHWATSDFGLFSTYIVASEEAFKRCVQWRAENSMALTRQVAARIRNFPIKCGASYRCNEETDYADVAFLLPESGTDLLLHVKTVWKGEAALFELVKSIFPDACKEYATSWLNGQRLDIFIPSLRVALEYQGEQHYRPVQHFGGEKVLSKTRERDQRKARACRDSRVILVEWKYNEHVDKATLLKKFKAAGIQWTDA